MLGKLRQARARCTELRELGNSPTSTELIKSDDATLGRLLWCLLIPGKPDAFMRLDTGQTGRDRFLMPVNVKALSRLWLADGLSSPKCPDGRLPRKDMTNDSKYRHAVDGFAAGRNLFMPLASVAFECRHVPSVRFNDGIARTLRLLANNIAALPMLVAGEGNAKALAKLAGTDGSIVRVSEVAHGPGKAPQSRRKPLDTRRGRVGQERTRNTSEKASRSQGGPSRDRGIGVDD